MHNSTLFSVYTSGTFGKVGPSYSIRLEDYDEAAMSKLTYRQANYGNFDRRLMYNTMELNCTEISLCLGLAETEPLILSKLVTLRGCI